MTVKQQILPEDVLKAFLQLQKFDSDSGDVITNMKAQKLLYYAQGVNYALNCAPLFDDDFEAWTHGPVIARLYRALKKFENRQIKMPNQENFDDSIFSDAQLTAIVRTYNTFGQFSAWKLRDMTHQEAPWMNTKPGEIIPKSAIEQYFTTRFAQTLE